MSQKKDGEGFEPVQALSVAGRKWYVAKDGHIYKKCVKTVGGEPLLEFIARDEEGYQAAVEAATGGLKEEPDHRLEYTPRLMPQQGHMRALFEQFLGKYSHEVFCWMGRGRDGVRCEGKFVFFVPEQEVMSAHVQIDRTAKHQEFLELAEPMGDVHTHPWPHMPRASGTDEHDMGGTSGVYGIVGSNQTAAWYASNGRGKTFFLLQWGFKKAKTLEGEVEVLTQGGKPLDQLLKAPPARHYGGRQQGECGEFTVHDRRRWAEDNEFWWDEQCDVTGLQKECEKALKGAGIGWVVARSAERMVVEAVGQKMAVPRLVLLVSRTDLDRAKKVITMQTKTGVVTSMGGGALWDS